MVPTGVKSGLWSHMAFYDQRKFFLLDRVKVFYALKYLAISFAVLIAISALDLFLLNLSVGNLSAAVIELSFAIFALIIMIYRFDKESYDGIKSFIFNYATIR